LNIQPNKHSPVLFRGHWRPPPIPNYWLQRGGQWRRQYRLHRFPCSRRSTSRSCVAEPAMPIRDSDWDKGQARSATRLSLRREQPMWSGAERELGPKSQSTSELQCITLSMEMRISHQIADHPHWRIVGFTQPY